MNFVSWHVLGKLSINPYRNFSEVHSFGVIVVYHVGNDAGHPLIVVLFHQFQSFRDDLVENIIIVGVKALARRQQSCGFQKN